MDGDIDILPQALHALRPPLLVLFPRAFELAHAMRIAQRVLTRAGEVRLVVVVAQNALESP